MALSQSVVSELLEAFGAGKGVDLIRPATGGQRPGSLPRFPGRWWCGDHAAVRVTV
jgi:hypothetical protein